MRALPLALGYGVAVLALAGPAAAVERLLVQQPDLLVVSDREVACGQAVPITMRTAEAGFFEQQDRLQRTVDSVRAMLGFECARLPGLEITGEAGRDEQVVFQGVAGDETAWLVERRNRPAADAGTAAGSSGGPLAVGGATVGAREIAGVHLGMTVEQAMNAAAGTFPGRPTYRVDGQVMQAMEGGCDFRFTEDRAPAIGWRCLEGAFSDSEVPRLHTIGLAQMVDQDQRDAIEKRLVERFGPPERVIRGEGADGNGGHPFLYLAWDDVLGNDRGQRLAFLDAPLRKLEAYAEVRRDRTMVTLWNQDPAAARQGEPEHRLKF